MQADHLVRDHHPGPKLLRLREGVTENISRSGLLFRSSSPLEVGSSMELMLEMPHELTGDDDARVVCEGSLVRVEPMPATREKEQSSFLMA
jgi:hypothetical protein